MADDGWAVSATAANDWGGQASANDAAAPAAEPSPRGEQASINDAAAPAADAWDDVPEAMEDISDEEIAKPERTELIRSSGRHTPCLVMINNRLLTYHPFAIRRMGSVKTAGLYTVVQVVGGTLMPASASITFYICDGEKTQAVARVTMQFNQDNYDQVVEELEPIATILAKQMKIDAVLHEWPQTKLMHGRQDPLQDVPEQESDLHYVQHICSAVVKITVAIEKASLTVRFIPAFWNRIARATPEKLVIANEIMRQLTDITAPTSQNRVHFTMFSCDHLHASKDWIYLPQLIADDPLEPLQGDHQLRDLSLRSLDMRITRPERPLPATDNFADERHRTITHVAALTDEVNLMVLKKDVCAEKVFTAAFMPIPGTEWKGDVADYGMQPDGQFTQYLVVVGVDTSLLGVMPDVGQKVTMFTNVPTRAWKMPLHTPTDAEVEERTRRVKCGLADAMTAADYARLNEIRRLTKMGRDTNIDGDELEHVDNAENEEALQDVWMESYLKHGGDVMRAYVGIDEIEADIIEEYPDETRRHRVMAERFAERMQQGVEETLDERSERIRHFVASSRVYAQEPSWGKRGPPHTAWRIANPAGETTQLVFFHFIVGPMVNWPAVNAKKPFLCFQPDEAPPIAGSKKNFFQKMLDSYTNYTVKLDWEIDTRSQKAEVSVWANINKLPTTTPGAQWIAWTVSLGPQQSKYNRNLHKVFPGIADAAASKDYSGETTLALKSLERTNAGKVFMIGCPGSGKTGFFLSLIRAANTRSVLPDAGYEDMGVWDGKIERHSDTKSKAQKPTDPRLGFDVTGRFGNIPSTTALKGTVVAPRDAKKEEKLVVVYTAATNAQLNDVANRLTALGIRVAKVYDYKKTLKAVTQGPPPAREPIETPEGRDQFMRKLVNHVNEQTTHQLGGNSMHTDPHSLLNVALDIFKGDPDAWKDIQFARAPNIDFDLNKAEHDRAGRRLLSHALSTVTVVLATPFQLHGLKYQFKDFKPNMGIVDEAGSMTEGQALTMVALYPELAIWFGGDDSQFVPRVQTLHATCEAPYEYRDVWGPQRKRSLLQRVRVNGMQDI